jgi:hypothetical protein
METPKHEGTPISISGTEYIVPPLSFKQFKALREDVMKLNTGDVSSSEEQQGVVLRIVHAALSRNYPDLTLDQVEDMLDLGNIHEIVKAIVGVNQLKKSMELTANPGKN